MLEKQNPMRNMLSKLKPVLDKSDITYNFGLFYNCLNRYYTKKGNKIMGCALDDLTRLTRDTAASWDLQLKREEVRLK
jgi:hypothetical protein